MSERVGLVLRQTSSATIILLQCGCPCLEWCNLYGLDVIVSVSVHPFHFNFVSIKGMIFATSMVACTVITGRGLVWFGNFLVDVIRLYFVVLELYFYLMYK